MSKRTMLWAAAGVLVVMGALWSGQAFSQPAGPGGGMWGPGGGDPNVWRMMLDPNYIRRAASDRMRQTLGATDEEWTVLEPKIEKVTTLSLQARGGGMIAMGMGMFGFGGRGGGMGGAGAAAGQQSELMKASQALAELLKNKDASAADIKSALQAYRDARARARAELEQAQKELKELLTMRQEAQLVQMGLLE